jgi:DNA topoisomerase-3
VIAEKPSVGRDIAKVLGCNTRGDGYLMGETYVVSWAVGHLATLCAPEDYDEAWKKWRFDTLPIMPQEMKLKAVSSGRSQLAVLKKLMNSDKIDSLICATDSGREGELIFRYIYKLCGCKKPFSRLWVSSMTDKAIRDGFAALRPGSEYDMLFDSARCRSEADWLVGINASRAYTLKYNALLSIGRVQTPTLAIIVDRAAEIAAFVPEEYYELQADFGAYTGIWQNADGSGSRIATQELAKELAKKVKGADGRVISVQREEKSQPSPQLYDLTELQRDCNKRYGFSAQKTLDLAQSLYETRKLLTYPRTDSRYLSDDLVDRLPGRVQNLANLPQFAEAAQPVLAMGRLTPGKRVVDNNKITDHHAIIPTEGRLRLDNVTPDEFKVFRLVALRFLSVFYPAYIYASTKVLTEAAGEKFLSKGQEDLQLGWRALYKDLGEQEKAGKSKKGAKEEQKLPNLREGDVYAVEKAQVLKKKTQPPKPYTEATLLSAMENAGRFVEDEALREQLKEGGLGTPATRAGIIERLLAVGYIKRQGKALMPTEKGEKLVAVVPNELKSAETTGKWEKGLSAIAGGRMATETFMASIRRYVEFLVRDCKASNRQMAFPEERKRYRKRSSAKSQ